MMKETKEDWISNCCIYTKSSLKKKTYQLVKYLNTEVVYYNYVRQDGYLSYI